MEFPGKAGVMILGGACLFPKTFLPLRIFEPRYRKMLEESLASHRTFIVALAQPGTPVENPLPIAGLGLIRASVENSDGTSNLLLHGLTRVRLGKVVRQQPYREMEFEALSEDDFDEDWVEALSLRLLDRVSERLRQDPSLPLAVLAQLAGFAIPSASEDVSVVDCVGALRRAGGPGFLADIVALLLLPDARCRRVIMEELDPARRLEWALKFLEAVIRNAKQESS